MLKCLPTRPRCLLTRPSRDQGLQCRDRGQDQDVQSRDQGETEAFEISNEGRQSRDRHYCASRRPRDRGVKTEATSLVYSHQPGLKAQQLDGNRTLRTLDISDPGVRLHLGKSPKRQIIWPKVDVTRVTWSLKNLTYLEYISKTMIKLETSNLIYSFIPAIPLKWQIIFPKGTWPRSLDP